MFLGLKSGKDHNVWYWLVWSFDSLNLRSRDYHCCLVFLILNFRSFKYKRVGTTSGCCLLLVLGPFLFIRFIFELILFVMDLLSLLAEKGYGKFTFKVHNGGRMEMVNVRLSYVEGRVDHVDHCDIDKLLLSLIWFRRRIWDILIQHCTTLYR